MRTSDPKHRSDTRDCRFKGIPGTAGIPLIGQLHQLIYNLPEFVESCHQKYGPVFRVHAGLEKLVFVLGAELAEEILIDKGRQYSTELGYRRLLPLFGRGLLQHDFEEHLFQRRMIQTAFKPNALRGYVVTLAQVMNNEVMRWGDIKNFRLHPNVKTLLFRCSLATFFGIHRPSEELAGALEAAFVDTLNGTLRIFDADIPGFRMHKAIRGRRMLRDYIGKLVSERRTGHGNDLLSYLCKERQENGEYFSDEAIIDHAGFILLAAHDTTASLLQYAIYYLTRYPEWLTRIREEVEGRSILDLTYEDLQDMKAMGWVIDEVLRINSSTPALMRGTLQTVSLNGVSIPANSTLLLITGFNHHSPEHWANPESFDPMRFSRERSEHQHHPFSYIPFGGGVHKCIGLHYARFQAALFISHFVNLYDFNTSANYRPRFNYLPLMRIRDGLPLKLQVRHGASSASL